MTTLEFAARKLVRAHAIKEYVREAGYRGVVAFSCGNATRALKTVLEPAGHTVLAIAPGGDLRAERWWRPAEVRRTFPDLFDATSGHLPAPVMVALAEAFREHLGRLDDGPWAVPTGSGETIVCLRWAYPTAVFVPVYGVGRGTEYEPEAPLNLAVAAGTPSAAGRAA